MINGIDILMVGQQAWDIEIGSNCKDVALEFSKSHRVLFINPPLDRITKLKHSSDPNVMKRLEIIKGRSAGLHFIANNLWVYYPDVLLESVNWIGSTKLFKYFNKKNNIRFASSIKKALDTLSFNRFVLFNDGDMYRSFHLAEFISPVASVYYLRDNLIATEYWKRHGRQIEPEIIRKSDICFANSRYLKQYGKKYNQNTFEVGQGCNLEHFRFPESLKVPAELLHITYPIIGYVGVITSSRLDIDLIYHLATQRPDYMIVFVGPEDASFIRSSLHELKNVLFLGPKPVEDLPEYINSFDVCINPQVVNELTIGNYPRKIDEYLALGKPVVATKTETMKSFKDYVFLAENKDSFLEKVDLALAEDNPNAQDSRIQFAFSHTWEDSVSRITNGINAFLNSKSSCR